MIKRFLMTIAIATLVVSCNKSEPKKIETVEEIVEEIVEETEVLPDMHNSQNSLDVDGVYKGITPCADCEGIETQLVLEKDNRYVLTTKYLGKGNGKVFEQEGKYSWNKEGSKITLSDDDKTQYKVGENKLIQLDLEGNEITGELSSHYVLTK